MIIILDYPQWFYHEYGFYKPKKTKPLLSLWFSKSGRRNTQFVFLLLLYLVHISLFFEKLTLNSYSKYFHRLNYASRVTLIPNFFHSVRGAVSMNTSAFEYTLHLLHMMKLQKDSQCTLNWTPWVRWTIQIWETCQKYCSPHSTTVTICWNPNFTTDPHIPWKLRQPHIAPRYKFYIEEETSKEK